MSGHSKWSSIKHKKGATDAKRGRLFTKLIKEITIAARGGGDPDGNPRLRSAVDNAKAASMPRENIDRAIKKGTGELDGGQIEEFTYEGYGPGGVALIIAVTTDNKNRITAEVRHTLAKNGGNLGENGCVAWMFNRKGLLIFEKKEGLTEDRLMEIGLEAEGFEDIKEDSENFNVYTEFTAMYAVKDAFDKAGLSPDETRMDYVPQTPKELEGKRAEQFLRLMETLEDNEDVSNVYSNSFISDAELQRIEES